MSSVGMSGGRWRITAVIGFSEFGEYKIVEIIFLQVGFQG
jgi:hypothetical protein